MRKIQLEADERYAIAMFQADSRVHTIRAIEEALPFIKDGKDEESDAATYAVAVSAVEKLKQMTDLDFRNEDWGLYLLDEESEDEAK